MKRGLVMSIGIGGVRMDIEKLGYMLAKVTHLQNLKAMGYTYIATDKDGDTFAYKSKPIKYEEVWESKEGFKIYGYFILEQVGMMQNRPLLTT